MKGDAPAAPAPHSKAKGPYVRGKKASMTLMLPPEIVARVDEEASRAGLTRNAWLTVAVTERLERRSQAAAQQQDAHSTTTNNDLSKTNS